MRIRFDTKNWDGGKLPQAGDIVSFPKTFSDFFLEQCTAASASDCQKGGVVSVRAPTGSSTATIQLAKLKLPLNGKMQFLSNTKMQFVTAETTKEVSWAARDYQFDFTCAANWVVTGTTANPNFAIPCHADIAVFSEVRLCSCSFSRG
jgi:hypothetical protein